MTTARYDGQTEWYESYASGEAHASARACAVRLLGSGPGRCLDLGCGTGRAIPALVSAGWSVVGTDVSADQLALPTPCTEYDVRALLSHIIGGLTRAALVGEGDPDALARPAMAEGVPA